MNFAPGLEALLAAVEQEEALLAESFDLSSEEADIIQDSILGMGTTSTTEFESESKTSESSGGTTSSSSGTGVLEQFIAGELPPPAQGNNKKNRNLTYSERLKVLLILVPHKLPNGKLHRKATRKAADYFNIHPMTCRRIWKRYKDTLSEDCPAGDVSNRRRNCGRKGRSQEDL
mmetsp:Transcript_3176/g.8774  ORF Transcript_3176/g.8774 Transcript_3176/m.8774 type:complete len:174 (+) Transcript_3176:157-678(+)